MAQATKAIVPKTARKAGSSPAGDLEVNLKSFVRHMKAENLAAKTIKTYSEAVEQFRDYLADQGMPQRIAHIKREHVEAWINHLLEQWSDATAANRYGGLRSFFGWAVEEGEIKESPMARMKPPKVGEKQVPIMSEGELAALFKACSGTDFESRRDLAILRLYAVTGARKSEIASIRWQPDEPLENDVDLDGGVIRVWGKGGRQRTLPVDAKTVRALDRYVRARAGHHSAHLPYLWLGKKGRMTPDGIAQMAMRRANQAGIEGFHLHRLRHTFAHYWLADGGAESDLMRLTGWRSRTMLQRYASSAAQERALAAAKKFGIGSRV